MLNLKGLKTVGSFVKDVLEVISPVVVTGLLMSGKYGYKTIVTYNDAVAAVMNSSLWSEDKTKVMTALKPGYSPTIYKAVIEVVKSSMWSGDKVNLILDMCKKAEESY